MSGSRSWLKLSWLLTASATWLGLSSCSGQSFSSSPTAGSDSGGSSAGTSSSGGSGSATGGSSAGADDTPNAGAPDTGGSAGSGGGSAGSGGTPTCNCAAGHYCRDGSIDCFDCAELNRLRFTSPERLATLSDNGQGSNFPRSGSTTTDLVYVFNGTGLRYTTDSSTSAGSSVKGTLPQDKGPLLLGESVTTFPTLGVMGLDFVFDRTDMVRDLYASNWTSGAQGAPKLPAPFNSGSGDYSLAVALHPGTAKVPRAFWMSLRNGKPELLTAPFVEAAVTEVVDVHLAKTPADKPCVITDQDASPWVSRDGKTLLFSHTRMDANCDAQVAQKRDLYTTLLQPATGQPPSDASNQVIPATPMNDVNSSADDVEPSFSADMCDLYFASNRDGNFAVYRAHRR